MKYGLKDRLADAVRNFCDRYSFNKPTLVAILIAIAVSALIAFGIARGVSPNTGDIMDDIGSLTESGQGILNTLSQLDDQDAMATSLITTVNSTVCRQTARIDGLTALLNALQTDVNNLVCSPPDAYLEGTFGDYTLYVKSSKTGDFTANVHLVYSPPLSAGNATNYTAVLQHFYSSINWTTANQLYIPTVAFNGTAWGICQVSFNTGTFTLNAHTEVIIPISYAGLQYQPSYAYVGAYSIH